MRRRNVLSFLTAFLLAIVLGGGSLSAFEISFKPITNIKPYFVWNNYPYTIVQPYPGGSKSKKMIKESPDFVELTQQKYMRYYESTSLFDVGLQISTEHINLVAMIDPQQDVYTYFTETQWTNIPYIGNSFYAIADMNWTKLGFIEFDYGNFYTSIGRRALKWGPASYDFAINDSAPFLDSIYADVKFPFSFGTFWYNYIVTGFNNTALGYPENHGSAEEQASVALNTKTLFSHKFGYENDSWRVTFSELNLIYNKIPSLLDASPLAFWHNNYQHDRSNVMIELTVEKLFDLTPMDFRIFGIFAMDDFAFGGESKTEKPNAMGFNLGIEFHFLDGRKQQTAITTRQDYTLYENSFKFSGGLNVSLEWFWATAFLYNRDNDSGKFTVPLWMYNFKDGGYFVDKNAFFIGFPYGPDTMVAKLGISWEDDPWKAYCDFELIFKGEYRISEEYNSANNSKFESYSLNGDVATIINTDFGLSYALFEGLLIDGNMGIYADLKNGKTACEFTIGCAVDPWALAK